jgi:hypothetical protein
MTVDDYPASMHLPGHSTESAFRNPSSRQVCPHGRLGTQAMCSVSHVSGLLTEAFLHPAKVSAKRHNEFFHKAKHASAPSAGRVLRPNSPKSHPRRISARARENPHGWDGWRGNQKKRPVARAFHPTPSPPGLSRPPPIRTPDKLPSPSIRSPDPPMGSPPSSTWGMSRSGLFDRHGPASGFPSGRGLRPTLHGHGRAEHPCFSFLSLFCVHLFALPIRGFISAGWADKPFALMIPYLGLACDTIVVGSAFNTFFSFIHLFHLFSKASDI